MLTLFLLLYVYDGDDYLVNLKVVSETTKCRDFTVISPVFFQKCTVILPIFYRNFLTALVKTKANTTKAHIHQSKEMYNESTTQTN